MITLGINAAFHDSAAALVVDGIVVAASEEERFTRIKHGKRPVPFSTWELPFHAIDDCLRQAGVTLDDVDHVAYSFEPEAFGTDPGLVEAATATIPMQLGRPAPGSAAASNGTNPWDALFLSSIVNAPGQLADGVPHHLRKRLSPMPSLSTSPSQSARREPAYRWHFVNHHLSHQASAFLASPFQRCAVMTLDGRGERATTAYGRYGRDRYESLGEVEVPHSLGFLYERMTRHLGFLHSSDEFKVMALAAYGEPRHFDALEASVRLLDDGRFEMLPVDFDQLFGPRRALGEALGQRHFDAAASVQRLLESTVLALARWLRRASGESRLAVAGGVALNSVLNSALRDSRIFDEVWIQPAAGDAGTALGAALWVDACERRDPPERDLPAAIGQRSGARPHQTLAPRRWQMDDACLGPGFSDAEIEQHLRWAKLTYRRTDDVAGDTAALLAQNQIIGWFQGRMEFGPRALGARSILGSPIDPGMQARLNELKDREDFRPVAPALPSERLGEWFTPADANQGRSPFMLFLYDVLPGQAARIPSACHADHTARVQTVEAHTQPRFHALLEAFGRQTGVPVLINTSFNVRGEPIVSTPRAAIEAFFSTPLDALVIGSFIVQKR